MSPQLTSPAQSVRSALVTPSSCLPSTSATLQSLLSPAQDTTSKPTTKTATTKTPTVRKAAPSRTTKSKAATNAQQDATKSLSPQDRYKLATDVVNISLRVLTDALKPSPKASPSSSPSSKRASSSGLAVVAECARLAFSYLRNARSSTDDSLQLETGMLAFSGKMISHGLDSLAMKELRILKACLQQKANAAKPPSTSEKETLASLLHLECQTSDTNVTSLVTSYHMNVLKLIVNSGRSATVEAAVEYLDLSNDMSPASLIIRAAEKSSDKTKAVKQLDSLAKLILSMCPATSSAMDQAALDFKAYASPETIFKLQMTVLEIQSKWWTLAGHKVNLEKELYEPLVRYLDTLKRRQHSNSPELYKLASDRAAELVNFNKQAKASQPASFAVLRSLGLVAEAAGMLEEALKLVDAMSSCSVIAPGPAVRQLICALRSLELGLEHEDAINRSSIRKQMNVCKSGLQGIVGKAPAFLDDLLVETAKLRKACLRNLTNVSEKQAGASLDDGVLASCELTLFCTDILVWYTRRTSKDKLSNSMAPKLATSFISSNLFTCRLLVSSSCDHIDVVQRALEGCVFLINTHDSPENRQLTVNISNLYWRCFQVLSSESEKPPPAAIACLQASVDVLRNREPAEQEAGFLATKLEKLGNLSKSGSASFKDSIRIQLQSSVLRDLTTSSNNNSLENIFKTYPKAAILRRNLHEYHVSAVKNPEGSTYYDDDQLCPLERAILLESQLVIFEEDLHKPSRRRKIRADFQELCTQLLAIYTLVDHPLRRASVCSRILKYAKEYHDLFDSHLIEEAIGSTINVDSCGLDQGLQSYAPYLEASLQLSQSFHTEPISLTRIDEALETLSNITSSCVEWAQVEAKVSDTNSLVSDLKVIACFMAVKGKEESRAKALQMLLRVRSLQPSQDPTELLSSITTVALHYLQMGYTSEASRILEQGESHIKQPNISPWVKAEWNIANIELCITIGKVEQAARYMSTATDMMRSMPSVEEGLKQHAQQIRAYFAYTCSIFSTSVGLVMEAMLHAKRYVALSQQAMSFLERQHAPQHDVSSPSATDAEGNLVKNMENLKISETELASDQTSHKISGAAYWTVIPILLRSFLHLSDMYAHQGMRMEASYYLDQADKLADSIGTPELHTKVTVQREAQACIEGTHEPKSILEELQGDSLDYVKLGITRGDAYAANAETFKEAQVAYDEAEAMAVRLSNRSFNDKIQILQQLDPASNAKSAPVRTTKRTVTKAPPVRARSVKAVKPTLAKSKAVASANVPSSIEHIALSSLCAAALRQKGLLLMNQGKGKLGLDLLEKADLMKCDPIQEVLQQTAMAEGLLLKFRDELALDFTFNVLPESTISFPALMGPAPKKGQPQISLSSTPLAAAKTASPKKISRQKGTNDDFSRSLSEAQERILSVQHRTAGTASMSTFHQICGLGSKAMLLLSAINAGTSMSGSLHPTRAACSIEMPRIEALSRELGTIEAEKGVSKSDYAVQYPATSPASTSYLSASRFQKEYIDIIPEKWTTVSLTLSDDLSELYITRYRAKQPPFLLRLPMTRNKMQDLDEDEESGAFDFAVGKAELQEIITLSNYSCSKPPSAMTKEAKESWWEEREALDLRMHELLVNIENIWLGGFRGVLSQQRRDSALLARFRKSFESILDRHLPSRQSIKSKAKKLVLDANILELFVGLGDDQDGEIDMDEQALDLLYFVIDVLQFNGERNAYDEVDFDAMATETLDALRSYHEAATHQESEHTHLILILDKKLHAFPWESLPCLQNVSVSRVGSMLTLQERILAMRRKLDQKNDDIYIVERNSGASVLNPSGDLPRTQATMEPMLDSLSKTDGSAWTSITGHAPTEKEFADNLSEKNMLLYFGHGSGNQYIRNRTVKKLDKCAEVVWLMGCSSGLVTEYGEYEPTSVPMSYLVAGSKRDKEPVDMETDVLQKTSTEREGLCMAVVATLWDVTDKDIDRFSVRLGEQWGLWSIPETPSQEFIPKTPRKRGRSMPKTPCKTPSRTTPGRSRSRLVLMGDECRKKSLVEAVAKSRDACHLRYLNGAATVVYGVPVYLGG